MGPKRKREEEKSEEGSQSIEEAIEERLNIDDEDRSISEEGSGEDLLENASQ
jgi:hypothetical protein